MIKPFISYVENLKCWYYIGPWKMLITYGFSMAYLYSCLPYFSWFDKLLIGCFNQHSLMHTDNSVLAWRKFEGNMPKTYKLLDKLSVLWMNRHVQHKWQRHYSHLHILKWQINKKRDDKLGKNHGCLSAAVSGKG